MSSNDITKPVDLLLHAAGTGHLRTRKPEYVDFMPPCNSACPAGENIQAWLAHAQAGAYEAAFQCILEENPFPAVMGRVCVKPCEKGCNRNHIDTTVNIHAVERYIGDLAIESGWKVRFHAEPSGKKVLVIGAGPAGLSAAYHLARMGHEVVVRDAQAKAGGLLEIAVPEYRLPKDILQAEIDRIRDMGVRIELNQPVNDVVKAKAEGGFDAVFLGIGAHRNKAEEIDLSSAAQALEAMQFLKAFYQGQTPDLGKHVMIYGGGKLAMYLARVIRRLGVESVRVCYPGDRKLMPAYDFEADDAIAEGVQVELLTAIRRMAGTTVTLELMKVEKNKILPTGETRETQADTLILATGLEADPHILRNLEGVGYKIDGSPEVNAERMIHADGIFAGGDLLGGERSATIAIGQGKKAARYLDAWLRNTAFEKGDKHPTAGYRRLVMWYETFAPKQEQDRIEPQRAVRSFEEVVAGLPEKEARYEAQRCLSCGNCFECDGCFGACPEDAIIKLGPGKRYRFNYDLCTGCAVCYEQCPCHAIEMVSESTQNTDNGKSE